MKLLRWKLQSAILLCSVLQPCVSTAQTTIDQTVDSATNVLDEVMAVPAKQIPQALLASASAVAIIPNVVKGGFVIGVRHGRGVVLVRDEAGNWHPPMFVSLTGGSVGWQAGIQSTDIVLVFRTPKSVDGLMSGKLTIGVDAAAAAGPVGRQAAAATDARLGAEILSYSRSRGLFAGVSVDGSMIQLDHATGGEYYQTPIVGANGQAIRPLNTAPPSAIRLMNRLAQYSGSPQIEAPAALQSLNIPPPSTTAAIPEVEVVRRKLAASWQRLSAMLDDSWRGYLAPPESVFPGGPTNLAAVQMALQKYATVASDQQYAALARSPDFVAIHQLLGEFLALQSTTQLKLPPPPSRR